MLQLNAIVLLAFVVYYTQCLPTQSSESNTKVQTGEKLQLYVNNGTEGVDHDLKPIVHHLEVEDQEIDAELYAVLPYLNFLYNSDEDGVPQDDCLDELEVQFVHDNMSKL